MNVRSQDVAHALGPPHGWVVWLAAGCGLIALLQRERTFSAGSRAVSREPIDPLGLDAVSVAVGALTALPMLASWVVMRR